MSPAAWTAIGGIITAALAALTSPQWIKRLEARDPARGWQAAITVLEKRITEQDKRIETLQDEVSHLESKLEESQNTIASKDRTIEGQSRLIQALTARMTQLETAWPPGLTIPPIDPAHMQILQSRP